MSLIRNGVLRAADFDASTSGTGAIQGFNPPGATAGTPVTPPPSSAHDDNFMAALKAGTAVPTMQSPEGQAFYKNNPDAAKSDANAAAQYFLSPDGQKTPNAAQHVSSLATDPNFAPHLDANTSAQIVSQYPPANPALPNKPMPKPAGFDSDVAAFGTPRSVNAPPGPGTYKLPSAGTPPVKGQPQTASQEIAAFGEPAPVSRSDGVGAQRGALAPSYPGRLTGDGFKDGAAIARYQKAFAAGAKMAGSATTHDPEFDLESQYDGGKGFAQAPKPQFHSAFDGANPPAPTPPVARSSPPNSAGALGTMGGYAVTPFDSVNPAVAAAAAASKSAGRSSYTGGRGSSNSRAANPIGVRGGQMGSGTWATANTGGSGNASR